METEIRAGTSLATVFVDELSNFFNNFCRFVVLGRPERSSSTDIPLALKRECHSKTTVRLKECSPRA
jgi:hypothetical protein